MGETPGIVHGRPQMLPVMHICPGGQVLALLTRTSAPLIGLQLDTSTTFRRSVSATPGFPSVMLRRTLSFGM